jgi:S-DNA-T family DNA segregation ATPase FtsK/SpoIIIE
VAIHSAKKSAPKPAPQSHIAEVLRVRVREAALGLFVAGFAFYLIALLSYSASDPGWSRSGHVDLVKNAAGPAGAMLADISFSFFGAIAYAIPFMLAYRAWLVFRHRRDLQIFEPLLFAVRGVGFILVVLSASGLAALADIGTSEWPYGTGGILGRELANACYASFHFAGSQLIFLTILFFGITIFTNMSWFALMDYLGAGVFSLRDLWRSQRELWASRREEVKEAEVHTTLRRESIARHVETEKKRVPPRIDIAAAITPNITLPTRKAQVAPPKPPKPVQKPLFDGPQGPLPSLELLDAPNHSHGKGFSPEALEGMSKLLEMKLADFGVTAKVVSVLPGPVITRFEIEPEAGVKVSRISNLVKDLARSLAVVSVRVVEVIPGKPYVGIEIPNEHREMVYLKDVMGSEAYQESKSPVTLVLGHDISGEPLVADLARMPHLLVAGTTGSGKSVGVNAMLLSLLYKASPQEVRLLMVDPKMLELSIYEGIPHLLAPVITDMKDAANGLRWAVAEMERRYKLMAALGVRNLAGFNKKVADAAKADTPILDPLFKPEQHFQPGEEIAKAPELIQLPTIVIVIDEFADMMMIVGKKVEELIARIAQKARAAGIHLILATQRPSVDVITGLIKANIPTRIAFQVSSRIDSRTILDQGGAEQLLGHGDMLYMPPGTGLPIRVHGAFVSDGEVHRVVADWKARGEPEYIEGLLEDGATNDSIPGYLAAENGGGEGSEVDALYDEAVRFVTESRRASISAVQRKLRIGYNRAARLIETMEEAGVVTAMGHNGNREVLAPPPPR